MILFKTIRSQIALYLSMLLFSGMFLIALTALFSFHNLSVSFAARNYSIYFGILAKEISATLRPVTYGIGMKFKNVGACRIYFMDIANNVHDFDHCRGGLEMVPGLAKKVFETGRSESRFVSSGFNLPFFSDAVRYHVVAGPVTSDTGSILGALVVAWDFDAAYSGFAKTEKLLFIYILINTFVLVAVGVYQIGNITAKPMKKILKRTESVLNDEFPLIKDSSNDFDQLSYSIGILIDDLASNKNFLQSTVAELETANSNMKKMQNEIIRAEKMASIGRLSAGLAHEIGNPVGIISGYLEMLKQPEIDDSERIDFASRANDELNRIDSIIRELLDYARPSDQGKIELSVHQLINDIVRAYAGSRAIGNIDLKTDLNADLDIVIANSDQLRQVFMNLIINASDAIFDSENRDKGQLKISTMNILKEEDNHSDIIISFVDNGCGLSEKDLENVFDPFFTTKPQGKGTGLGLSVSLMIIEDIAGSIKALPCDVCGTEFLITLPLTKGA